MLSLKLASLKGATGKVLSVAPATTVGELRAQVRAAMELPDDAFVMVIAGKILRDAGVTLGALAVKDNATLVVTMPKTASTPAAAAAPAAAPTAAPAAPAAAAAVVPAVTVPAPVAAAAAPLPAESPATPLSSPAGTTTTSTSTTAGSRYITEQLLTDGGLATAFLAALDAAAQAPAGSRDQQRQRQGTAALARADPAGYTRVLDALVRDYAQGGLGSGLGAAVAGSSGAQRGGGRAVRVELTRAEADAVARIADMGFGRERAVEAFLACDKNEEWAVNYLLSQNED